MQVLKWKYPGRVENIFSALSTVVPSHLMDGKLFDFMSLEIDGVARPDGDIAFDEDDPCTAGSDGMAGDLPQTASVSAIIPVRRKKAPDGV